MQPPQTESLETDPRFPSGPWTGYFVQSGKHFMDLHLSFRQGVLTGEGRDRVGRFIIKGKYFIQDGKCHWTKRYIGQHDVAYSGYNEGKGIWGVWEIPPFFRGGFHIWPEGMADAEHLELEEEADLPVPMEGTLETSDPLAPSIL
jgi:hypothetical protein